jgi:hypothetical protein
MHEMTLRERWINTFRHQKVDRIVFSPRIHYWYARNGLWSWFLPVPKPKRLGPVPPYLGDKFPWQVFDYLGASPRYVLDNFVLPLWWNSIKHGEKVGRYYAFSAGDNVLVTEYRTPIGKIRKVAKGGYPVKHLIETPKDMKIMRYVLRSLKFNLPRPLFHVADAALGPRGIVQTFFPRSPLMRLIVDYMGFERTILNLRRFPNEMHELIVALEEWDDTMFKVLCESPIPVFNFGDNIDANLTPPHYFEKFLVPYYRKRVQQLHHAGKYVHIHMDGSLKDLLPFFDTLDFDAFEALTAKPQGNVTLEEVKTAVGKKILIDGIPAVLFLPQYSFQYVRDYTRKVLEMFSPRLVLGVSDEMPPDGQFGKIQMIAKMVQNFSP